MRIIDVLLSTVLPSIAFAHVVTIFFENCLIPSLLYKISQLSMDTIINALATCAMDHAGVKSPPGYLDLRNGRIDLKPDFINSADTSSLLPALLIKEAGPVSSLASAAAPVSFQLAQLLQTEVVNVQGRICDHLTEYALEGASLRLLGNVGGELREVEQRLTQIVEEDRMDIHSFSQNALTNCCAYSVLGQVQDIQTIAIDPASKKYAQEELLNHAPHPIRTLRKKKAVPREGDRKTRQQILEEFQLLNGLFSVGEQGKEGKEVPFREILDLVSLSDGADYNSLWNQIMEDLSLEKEKLNKPKKNKISQQMGDEEFNKTIDRIVKEATQYEHDTHEEEEEEQQQQQEQGEPSEQAPKEQEKGQDGFQSIRIEKKTESRNKTWQWAVEDNSDLSNFYDLLPKEKFAVQYHFELDEFQKRSILHLQRKESVFVAAHTSAGKTVVAEYGIALALKHKRKVIYTSPIKALSNQKYRQLSRRFDSVGIVTGDVSMNPQASCVIMTTEILRNNLYRGTEMIRDIEWVIFDEVHYINNQERGVVWEQTIIMLPEHIGLIMLSATVPNYMDFANWVGRTKRRVVYVMKTLHRPVPLEHSLYIFGKFHVIKQPNGRFLKEDYNEIKNHINQLARGHDAKKAELKQEKRKKIEEKGFYNDNRREQRLKLMTKSAVDKFIKKITRADLETSEGKQDFRVLEELIAHCHKNNLLPAVVFTFSKKKINALAQKIYLFDLTNRLQKSKIRRLISHALSTLKPQDRALQQFDFLCEICMNGYAVHHGDLLPLAKEIVELLFSQGLIKVLFATETFAMGINMPTKTVIYHTIKKVSGSDGSHRFLNSSEYVQMSGRAGRRGLDEKGNVIIIAKDPGNLPDAEEMVRMMDYPGEHLVSKFKVTYQIILNLYNSKDINVQEMMRQSFMEDPKFKEFTSNIKKVKQLKNNYEQLSEFDCPFNKLGTRILMEEYVSLGRTLRDGNTERFWQNEFKKAPLPRFALLLGHNNEVQLCLLLRVEKTNLDRALQVLLVNKVFAGVEINKEDREAEEAKLGIKKRIILQFDNSRSSTLKEMNGAVEGTNNLYQFNVYWVTPAEVLQVYREKLNFKKQLDDSKKTYSEIATQLLSPPKQLTPLHNYLQEENVFNAFTAMECHTCSRKEAHMHQQAKRTATKAEVSTTARRINKNQLGLMGSFQGMIKLLNDFKFITDEALTLKGRVAREVDIYVAQVIVEAVLDPLNPAEIAALMSAFVCDFKPRPARGEPPSFSPFNNNDTYTKALDTAITQTHSIVRRIVDYQINNEAYLNPLPQEELLFSILNFHLADTVYKWAVGFDFADARFDSNAPEGTVVRTIMRLSMLLGNIKSVCRILGSSDLEAKIDEANDCIKRDIVFCQSLYLSA